MRYYGRGAKGNRVLSEGEVAALYLRRERWEVDRENPLRYELARAPEVGPQLRTGPSRRRSPSGCLRLRFTLGAIDAPVPTPQACRGELTLGFVGWKEDRAGYLRVRGPHPVPTASPLGDKLVTSVP
jgi:hypothetical protein